MKRKSFLKRARQSEEMSLQITSMADIFIILLVFLLKSYSAGTITITPSPGTKLPEAALNDKAAEALKVEISEGAVLVDGRPVAKINGFVFDSRDLGENGVSHSLKQAFEQERAREAADKGQLMALGGGDETRRDDGNAPGGQGKEIQADPRILVVADQRAPYATLKTVLASAATEGYTDIKLAVIHAE